MTASARCFRYRPGENDDDGLSQVAADMAHEQGESDERRRRKADLDAATQPANGASVSAAHSGASLSADEEDSETEKALKKAAHNDRGRNG